MPGLDFWIRLKNAEANKGLADFHSRVKAFRKDFNNVGKVALAAGFTLGLRQGLADARQFQKGMREVFTLLPNASKEARDKLTRDARALAMELKILPEKIVPALYQAISAGVPEGNVIDFLRVSGQAAKGGVTEILTAVDGITSAVNAYGVDALGAQKASDLMFTAVRLGKTTFNELASSMAQVTPFASALGITFEEVNAAVVSLTAKGTPTAQAMTQIRALLVDLSKEGSESATVFKGISGKTFPEFIRSGGTLGEVLQMLQDYSRESGREMLQLFARVEAGAAALGLLADDKYVNALNEMANAAGATKTAFEEMQSSVDANLEGVEVRARMAAERASGWLLSMADNVSFAFGTAAGAIANMFDSVPDKTDFGAYREIAAKNLRRRGAVPNATMERAEQIGGKAARREAWDKMVDEEAMRLWLLEDANRKKHQAAPKTPPVTTPGSAPGGKPTVGDPEKLKTLLGQEGGTTGENSVSDAEAKARARALDTARRMERDAEEALYLEGLSPEERLAYNQSKIRFRLGQADMAERSGNELDAARLRTEAKQLELDVLRDSGRLDTSGGGGTRETIANSLQRIGLASNSASGPLTNPEAEKQTTLQRQMVDYLAIIAQREYGGDGDGFAEFGGSFSGEIV